MKKVVVADRKVLPLFYRGRPVVTLPQVDEFHGRPKNTAKRNFWSNRKHFIPELDFFEVPFEEYSQLLTGRISSGQSAVDGTNFVPSKKAKGGSRVPMIFLTETGYLMVVKSLSDDKSWSIHRALVMGYFKKRQPNRPATDAEIAAIRADVVSLGTTATAQKYGRSRTFVKVCTTEVRRAKAEQLSLFV